MNITSFSAAYQTLKAAQKKRSSGTPLYTQEVNRRLGRLIAAGLAGTSITPNQLSMISLVLTVAALGLLLSAEPSVFVALSTVTLLLIGYAFDSADGQMARLKGLQGIQGEWLDHVIDCFKTIAVHWTVFFYLFKNSEIDVALLVAVVFVFQSAAMLLYFSGILKEKLKPVPKGQGVGSYRPLISMALLIFDYGLFCMIFGLSFAPMLFFSAYAGLGLVVSVATLGLLLRTFRLLG